MNTFWRQFFGVLLVLAGIIFLIIAFLSLFNFKVSDWVVKFIGVIGAIALAVILAYYGINTWQGKDTAEEAKKLADNMQKKYEILTKPTPSATYTTTQTTVT